MVTFTIQFMAERSIVCLLSYFRLKNGLSLDISVTGERQQSFGLCSSVPINLIKIRLVNPLLYSKS